MIEAQRIDLLPGFVAARRRARRILQSSTVVVSAFAVASAVTYLTQGFQLRDARADLDIQLMTNASVAVEVSRLADLETIKLHLDAQQAALTQLFADEVRWSVVLADIQAVLPGHTWLTGMSITMREGEKGIADVAFQGTTVSHIGTSLWLQRLSRVPGFDDPWFTISSKRVVEDQELVTFSSTVTVMPEALRANTPGADRTLGLKTKRGGA